MNLPLVVPNNTVNLLDGNIWIIYIVGIIIWIFYSVIKEKDEKKALQEEIASIPQLEIKVTKTKLPEEIKLGPMPSFKVEFRGWVSHPTDPTIKLNLFIKDVYLNDEGEEKVMPISCPVLPDWTEGTTRFLRLTEEINTSPFGHFKEFTHFKFIPIEYISGPFKGKRKLRFSLVATDVDAQSDWGSFSEDQVSKIRHIANTDIDHTFTEVGFLENFFNREQIENLSIKVALAIAASDGNLDQKELNIIKEWANLSTTNLEEKEAKEKKKKLSKFIKEAYVEAKSKKISVSGLIEELNDKAIKEQKYELVDLLLKVVSADDELSKEEDMMLNKIVKKLEIDQKTYNQMKNKTIASVGKIETSDYSSGSDEQLLGLSDELTDQEKCKELRKLYSKWNGLTNSSNKQTKTRAKEMVKKIANLRSKYNC